LPTSEKKSKIKVACYPGPKGSFADIVTRKLFNTEPLYLDIISDAFFNYDYAVIPYETVAGRVNAVDRMLMESKVKICKKISVPVEFSLAGFCKKHEVEAVYSKEEALVQCSQYLSRLGVRKIKTDSTVEMLNSLRGTRNAVICYEHSANQSNVPIIERKISSGRTVFVVLSKNDADYEENKRFETCLIYELKHSRQFGALERNLREVFTKHKINLSSINSIPLIDNGDIREYAFVVWIEGHRDQIRPALKKLKESATLLYISSCELKSLFISGSKL